MLCSGLRQFEWRRTAPFLLNEDFDGLGLGDLGCAAVSAASQVPRNAGLKELSLGGNGITDDGVEALAEVLALGGTNLRRLSLHDNNIHDRGANAMAKALATSSTLEEVDLWGNSISDAGRLAIISAAKCEVFLELPRP